jgi:hypothetical protein
MPPADAVTWTSLYAVVGVLVAFGGGLIGVVLWLWGRFSNCERDLNDFRLYVEREFVQTHTFNRFDDRLTAAIERLSDRIEDVVRVAARTCPLVDRNSRGED